MLAAKFTVGLRFIPMPLKNPIYANLRPLGGMDRGMVAHSGFPGRPEESS
jgi:hypothetical protein